MNRFVKALLVGGGMLLLLWSLIPALFDGFKSREGAAVLIGKTQLTQLWVSVKPLVNLSPDIQRSSLADLQTRMTAASAKFGSSYVISTDIVSKLYADQQPIAWCKISADPPVCVVLCADGVVAVRRDAKSMNELIIAEAASRNRKLSDE